MSALVLRREADGIVNLTLNRPEKRNALNLATWAELDAHIAAIREGGDAIGVVVLKANGSIFCGAIS